jgi:hypothetical protein
MREDSKQLHDYEQYMNFYNENDDDDVNKNNNIHLNPVITTSVYTTLRL